MSITGPEHISTIVERFLCGRGHFAALALAIVRAWPRVVGERIAREAQPVGLRDGVLTVQVAQPLWLAQLRFLAPDIQEALNRHLGQGQLVREIRWRQGPLLDEVETGAPPATCSPPVGTRERMVAALTADQEEMLHQVVDPEIREALRILLKRQLSRRPE